MGIVQLPRSFMKIKDYLELKRHSPNLSLLLATLFVHFPEAVSMDFAVR